MSNTDGDIGGNIPYDDNKVIVILTGDPLSTAVQTKPGKGKRINFNSQAVRDYRQVLADTRQLFKQGLQDNAPDANVTGKLDISLNGVEVDLNGVSADFIKIAPMVVEVLYQGVYTPAVKEKNTIITNSNVSIGDPDLALINAVQAWGGSQTAGAGLKIAIIDTGIDQNHPYFDPTNFVMPPGFPLGDQAFTTNKVIVAKVFNNKTKSRNYTPKAIQDHGTHVAGTAAGNYQTSASYLGVQIPYKPSGVAPGAFLGNYNVFPDNVIDNRSEDILNAIEAAYEDGMDVVNMSLSDRPLFNGILDRAVNNLTDAGLLFAISAGNFGPNFFRIGGPGNAVKSVTSGASSVPHYVGWPVSFVDSNNQPISTTGSTSQFTTVPPTIVTAPVKALLASDGSLSLGCNPIPVDFFKDKIALLSRGVCTFSAKIRNAQQAGALAVIIVNNVIGNPTAMARDSSPNDPNEPTIPATMVARDIGDDLRLISGGNVTIDFTDPLYVLTSDDPTTVNILASFSSVGPTNVDFRIKPDLITPGVNVLSSVLNNKWEFFNGTSMASPHVAGSAAVVKWKQPTWSPDQIRSALVNTANRNAVKKFTDASKESDVLKIGSGLLDLNAAVQAQIALDPVSISFGGIPAKSAQSKTISLILTNISPAALNGLSITIGERLPSSSAVIFTISYAPTSLAVGASVTAIVKVSTTKNSLAGFYQATLIINKGATEIAHAPLFALIK